MSSTVVIVGASGDLTQRKLVPSLFNLYRKGRLPADTRIVGFARRPYTDEAFRDIMHAGAQKFGGNPVLDEATWAAFAPMLRYVQGDLETPDDFTRLAKTLQQIEGGPANRLYYLATAPGLYIPAVTYLGDAGMASQREGWRDIII